MWYKSNLEGENYTAYPPIKIFIVAGRVLIWFNSDLNHGLLSPDYIYIIAMLVILINHE